jgi:hypothetical protein
VFDVRQTGATWGMESGQGMRSDAEPAVQIGFARADLVACGTCGSEPCSRIWMNVDGDDESELSYIRGLFDGL